MGVGLDKSVAELGSDISGLATELEIASRPFQGPRIYEGSRGKLHFNL